MRCPNCGAEVPAGAVACPSCHYDLGLTQRIPVTKVAWCPTCGALVPPDALLPQVRRPCWRDSPFQEWTGRA